MYICILCSSARKTGGLLFSHQVNWFDPCPDGPPEECPTCGSPLGILKLDVSEPAAVAMAGETLLAQRGIIEELRLTLAAEQGDPDGAPSEGWITPHDPENLLFWEKRVEQDGRMATCVVVPNSPFERQAIGTGLPWRVEINGWRRDWETRHAASARAAMRAAVDIVARARLVKP